ncbi:formate/nitrite transporter family protein [soil metagenome]
MRAVALGRQQSLLVTDKSTNKGVRQSEVKEVKEHARLRAPVIYEIVRREGEGELERPASSLWWSGLAAGFGLSASVFTQGLLHEKLPDGALRAPIESFGYCFGFLIVVLSRLQLFTENTLTAVLPLFSEWSRQSILNTARLWGIVLAANLTGTFLAAALAVYGHVPTPEQLAATYEVARNAVDASALGNLLHSIPAGFFIAAMVWMLPSADTSRFWVIVAITYVIALGEFPHVIAGSTDAFLLLVSGQMGFVHCFAGYLLPTLAGNVIGGTGLFALLAYAQIRKEI